VRHHRSRIRRHPSRRSTPVSGRESVRAGPVSRFGWHGCFPVPAMHAYSAGAPSGSRIAASDRPGRREASLNRMADPRDHGMIRGAVAQRSWPVPGGRKNAADREKVLDPEHSRLEPFILVVPGRGPTRTLRGQGRPPPRNDQWPDCKGYRLCRRSRIGPRRADQWASSRVRGRSPRAGAAGCHKLRNFPML
jgi:hypothetical protein